MRPVQTIALDDAVRALVAAEVDRLLDERGALDWVPHVALPFGSRARNAVIARRIPGARRMGKMWLVPRAALSAFIEREGERYVPAEPPKDEQADPAMLAAIARRRRR